MEMLIARYMHPDNGRPNEREDAKNRLEVGRSYKVTRIDVVQSYTTVWLQGLGDGLCDGFNSVHFDFYAMESVAVPEELKRPAVLGMFEAAELGVRRLKGSERVGEWIPYKFKIYSDTVQVATNYKCNKCGYDPVFEHIEELRYCPNCGAKMED